MFERFRCRTALRSYRCNGVTNGRKNSVLVVTLRKCVTDIICELFLVFVARIVVPFLVQPLRIFIDFRTIRWHEVAVIFIVPRPVDDMVVFLIALLTFGFHFFDGIFWKQVVQVLLTRIPAIISQQVFESDNIIVRPTFEIIISSEHWLNRYTLHFANIKNPIWIKVAYLILTEVVITIRVRCRRVN